MRDMNLGDIVCRYGSDIRMIVLSRDEDIQWSSGASPTVSCAWEANDILHTAVFRICDLMMLRKEQRRMPRNGQIAFPSN